MTDWEQEARRERHEREEAHAARVARAMVAGTSPADFARRATEDAWELRDAATVVAHRLADAGEVHNPAAVRFDLAASAEARAWDADRAAAAVRRARSLRLFWREDRHHPGTFSLEGITGDRCPSCGRPRMAVFPQHHQDAADAATGTLDIFAAAAAEAPQEGPEPPCPRCWSNPHQEEDTRALLEVIARRWIAYVANGDRGGESMPHPYMRYEFTWIGSYRHAEDEPERVPFEAPAEWPRCYVHRDDDRHEARALAQLIARGHVAVIERDGPYRRIFALTPAGAEAIGYEFPTGPLPNRTGTIRTHERPKAPESSAERRERATAMTAQLAAIRAGEPQAPAPIDCTRCGPDHWRPCPHVFTCPDCHAGPGNLCRRPSGHEAPELHAARVALARADWTPEQHEAEAAWEAAQRPAPPVPTPEPAPVGAALTLF